MNTKDIVLLARKNGLCKPWFEDFQRDNSLETLCAKYFDGSDWAMEHDFPPLSVLKSYKGKSDDYGLHTDYEGNIGAVNGLNQFAFFGDSVVDFEAEGFSVSHLIIRHNSKVNISASQNAIVIVNIIDNAKVDIEVFDDAAVTVHDYGNKTKIRKDGNVTVHQSNFE